MQIDYISEILGQDIQEELVEKDPFVDFWVYPYGDPLLLLGGSENQEVCTEKKK